MKDEGNDTIYLAMKKRDPKLTSDFLVIHEVDNQVQIDYIQAHLSDLTNYLRENLKNWGINLQFSLSETTEESIQLLTGKDKFHALARKNPNLYTLQKTFNLDINY
jgi:DNA polymerase-3 subunit gamma/tau